VHYPVPIARLIEEFNRLPGIGPKSAQRLTFHILQRPSEDVERLATAILEARRRIRYCSTCMNVTDVDPCRICRDAGRDRRVICVVEEPRDLVAMEKTREYKGLYHVLHGAISPIDGIGPDELKVKELLARLEDGRTAEVIVATNPDVEGEATALYLGRILRPIGVKVTRIASGLPVGGDLDYADEVTLGKALQGRREL